MATDRATWLSPAQAARRLELSAQRVRQLADAGTLECVNTSLGRLISAESVAKLKKERAKR